MTAEDRYEGLLERATTALERIDATFERQAVSFERQAASFDRQATAHERMMRRIERTETLVIDTLGDIDLSIQRSGEQVRTAIDDMRDRLDANTKAVLAMIDRLGPATG